MTCPVQEENKYATAHTGTKCYFAVWFGMETNLLNLNSYTQGSVQTYQPDISFGFLIASHIWFLLSQTETVGVKRNSAWPQSGKSNQSFKTWYGGDCFQATGDAEEKNKNDRKGKISVLPMLFGWEKTELSKTAPEMSHYALLTLLKYFNTVFPP